MSEPHRRHLLRCAAALALAPSLPPLRAADVPWPTAAIEALRRGGVVAAFRHASAPGTFDPPGFRLDDCSTQRNLDETGRDQARRLGQQFRRLDLQPAVVRSSPWCRCLDTARLAFGDAVQSWPPLRSTRAADADESRQLATLRAALAQVVAGRFEVWISHQFTLGALAGQSLASGAGLLLRADADGGVRIVATLPVA
jgi:phosphohistidine phosphatase SixA